MCWSVPFTVWKLSGVSNVSTTCGRSVWTQQFLSAASCFHTFPLPLQDEPVPTANNCFRNSWACQPSSVMLPQGPGENFILYYQLRCNRSGVKGSHDIHTPSSQQWQTNSSFTFTREEGKKHKCEKNIWRNFLYDSETETEEFVKSAGRGQRMEGNLVSLELSKVFQWWWWLFMHIVSIYFFFLCLM